MTSVRLLSRAFLRDWLDQPAAQCITVGLLGRAGLRLGIERQLGMRLSLLAHRLSLRLQRGVEPTRLQARIEGAVKAALPSGTFTQAAWRAAAPGLEEDLHRRAIILKAPRRDEAGRVEERGVLLVTFTHLFGELTRSVDLQRLRQDYTLVLEPSWAGCALPEILQFAEGDGPPVYVMATEDRDFGLIERFSPRLVPLPFGASNWVDPEVFRPHPDLPKRFDAVYIGFWGAVKRHHALFRSLRALADPTFRVALIGGAWEGRSEEVATLARRYGVLAQLEFFEQLTPGEVSQVVASAKVSLLLSRKEGSNRGLFESMFCDVPGLLIRENLGVRNDYLNEATGRVVPERDLAQTLAWFREHWRQFTPRQWATAHLAPEVTTAALNAALRRQAALGREPWTTDCVPKLNRPEVTYLRPADASHLPTTRQVLAEYARTQGMDQPASPTGGHDPRGGSRR